MGKYAILIVSALIFSMITYSHGLKNALLISNTRTVQSFSENQAHNIAQSAVMAAVYDLRNTDNSSLSGIVENLEVGGSQYYPSINDFEAWPELEGEYNLLFKKTVRTINGIPKELLQIESTGRFEDTNYTVKLGLWFGSSMWNPDIYQALHAENQISGSGTIEVKCEDEYGDPIDASDCFVTFNSIDQNQFGLNSNSTLDAKLSIGPEGDISQFEADNIKGGVDVMPKELDYPMPIFPNYDSEVFVDYPDYTPNSTTNINLENDYTRISEILMTRGNNTLTINTGSTDKVLRLNRLDLQSQNQIKIEGEGKLTLYIDNKLEMTAGAKINEDGESNQLMVYFKGNQEVEIDDEIETIDFGARTLLNGSIFAEHANIKMRGSGGIQGDIITGGNVEMDGTSSAVSRVVYAPNGTVETKGTVDIRGAVISHNYIASGTTTLTYDPEFMSNVPDLEVAGGFPIAYWN